MLTSWIVIAPMVVAAVLVGIGMVAVTGHAERSVRRAQHLRQTLHEALL